MQPGEMWSLGDYSAAGDRWAEASTLLADTYVEPDQAVLDVACGPGPLCPYLQQGGGPSPVAKWAERESVSEIFAGLPVRLEFAQRTVEVVWDDLDQAVREITERNPAWIMIRSAVEPTGRWNELEAGLRELLSNGGSDIGGRFVLPVDYLETLARKL